MSTIPHKGKLPKEGAPGGLVFFSCGASSRQMWGFRDQMRVAPQIF
jgi:hypothetical protein